MVAAHSMVGCTEATASKVQALLWHMHPTDGSLAKHHGTCYAQT